MSDVKVVDREITKTKDSHKALRRLPDSPAKMTRQEFGLAMAHLCALKRTANFSDTQVLAWYAVLCDFGAKIVNESVIQLCLTETRFPELGDLWQACVKLRNKRQPPAYTSHGTGHDLSVPTHAEVKTIADRFGLEI